jgi:ATP-dependent DNA helicase RecQ
LQLLDHFQDPVRSCLWRKFQLSSFLPGQEAIVRHLVDGDDALVIRPTGGGKSLCFQLPGIIREGTCLVISPLISLMSDQTQKLQAKGIKAYALHSALNARMQSSILDQLKKGEVNMLYLSPERLCHRDFFPILSEIPISLIAFDEAHCLSMWGHEFRPQYFEAAKLLRDFPEVPKVALTASADYHTRREIIEALGMNKAKIFVNSMDRPNLSIEHIKKKNDGVKQLISLLTRYGQQSGIVYCLSRRKCEEVAEILQSEGYNCQAYHAGLPAQQRTQTQELFLANKIDIIVATIAFGMGIDKPDIRFVVHVDMPKNLEGYYQEMGRAGRDGHTAQTILFYSRADKAMLGRMIRMSTDDETRQRIELFKLDTMEALCHARGCKRKLLLLQFEDQSAQNCANCSWCRGDESTNEEGIDYTYFLLTLLNSVHVSQNKRPLEWWLRHLANNLQDYKIQAEEFKLLGTYKCLKFLLHQILIHGLLAHNLHGHLSLTQESLRFLKSGQRFQISMFPWKKKVKKRRRLS